MKKILPFLLLLTMAASCVKNEDDKVPDTQLNVSYGSHAQQKMDIYLPPQRSSSTTKVLIMIHGGGWSGGDKSDFTAGIAGVQQLLPGYAIFNINYRLVGSGNVNVFPAQEEDVKAAVEYIYNRREQFQISDKFVYLGASAGGHLALLQGYKHTNVVRPKAIIDFFGPTDLTALFNNSALAALLLPQALGGTPTTNASLYQSSSPINYVTAQSSATMILQGGTDDLVPPSQSTALRDKLNTLGVANQYVFYPNEGHGWGDPNATDSYLKIAAFLQIHNP
jgi:acetyl esterase/lipase